jgi:hypothetical protein
MTAKATLKRNIGGILLEIPVDFGNGEEYIKVGMQVVSTPKSDMQKRHRDIVIKNAVAAACTDPVIVSGNTKVSISTGGETTQHTHTLHEMLAHTICQRTRGNKNVD